MIGGFHKHKGFVRV